MNEFEGHLRDIVHGVKSKCGPLIDAAERLRKESSAAERDRLIAMMLESAHDVVALLKSYRSHADAH